MITLDKINVYKSFNGDIDGWARIGTNDQKAIMKDQDWLLIDGFIQDILLVKKGLATQAYMDLINRELQKVCDSEESINALKSMAK